MTTKLKGGLTSQHIEFTDAADEITVVLPSGDSVVVMGDGTVFAEGNGTLKNGRRFYYDTEFDLGKALKKEKKKAKKTADGQAPYTFSAFPSDH